ncbi:MAG TPA: 2,3-diphosphoglycerate-dependent phosphoglycerate mutase [Oxalicibacterium sp.]|uniref:2,3-diphosphoglycerate-dependent phosphoglycerate mutase n=1 Tax=Oxalicibacterium sp. TaxID=2766525 RepID=UPI002B8D94AD|nr:2,3-diphosphoglycerate-dependent phosphoglycerate mutase [Oxalicibacterium sp.]HWU98656.1 2,3-diphosphoglycerate-dependent phosphoglycerate mutase [Oxalicibacterium sp.]
MGNLVIVRHGESQWNMENRFTGWTDIDITEKGRQQARRAGRALADAGFHFDLAVTSVLKRTIRSQWLILDEMDAMYTPILKHWRLNERHYGGLTGLRRDDTIARFGEDQVWKWRRGFDSRPPLMDATDPRAPFREARYHDIPQQLLPLGESLKDTVERVRVYWDEAIVPVLKQGKNVIICTHGNSQRALVKLVEDMPDDEVASFDVPNGVPLIYKLDADLRVLDRHSMQIAEATVSAIL